MDSDAVEREHYPQVDCWCAPDLRLVDDQEVCVHHHRAPIEGMADALRRTRALRKLAPRTRITRLLKKLAPRLPEIAAQGGFRANGVRSRRIKYAMPQWADSDAIKAVYARARTLTALTGIKHSVDHVIPLNGKTVCGLHVETNLQVLMADANSSKGNQHESAVSL